MNYKIRFVYILFLLLFFISCSASIPSPIPIENRIICFTTPFEDLTGSYDMIEPKFEDIFKSEIRKDYAQHYMKGPTAGYDETIYLTNLFYITDTLQDLQKQKSDADLLIEGRVEQVTYGSPNEIDKYIIDAYLGGLWGIMLRDKKNKNTRAGFVEYKISFFSLPQKKLINTIVVQGAYKSTSFDRKEIIKNANVIAAQELAYKLNNEVSKYYNKRPIHFH